MNIQRISIINQASKINTNCTSFSGGSTSNAVATGVDFINKNSKILNKKVGYSMLGVLIVGTLGYNMFKDDNETVKHASRYIPK